MSSSSSSSSSRWEEEEDEEEEDDEPMADPAETAGEVDVEQEHLRRSEQVFVRSTEAGPARGSGRTALTLTEVQEDVAFLELVARYRSASVPELEEAAGGFLDAPVTDQSSVEDLRERFRTAAALLRGSAMRGTEGDMVEVRRRRGLFGPTAESFKDRRKRWMQALVGLNLAAMKHWTREGADGTASNQPYGKQGPWTDVLKASSQCFSALAQTHLHRLLAGHSDDEAVKQQLAEVDPTAVFNASQEEDEELHQKLRDELFKICYKRKYRRLGTVLYEPHYIGNTFTHYYKEVGEIKDFIWQVFYPVSEDYNKHWYNILTKKSNIPHMMQSELECTKHELLPDLERNRYIHAFRDGLFVLHRCTFYPFDPEEARRASAASGYEMPTAADLEGNTVAVQFHDVDFGWAQIQRDVWGSGKDDARPDNGHFMYARCEHLDQIFRKQKFSLPDQVFILAMMGRLFFRVGDYDNWGVFVFFLGIAGTGKSTLLRLVTNMFPTLDVGYFNNALQTTFALDGLADKLLVVGLDVDRHFRLDQATFQSMVVGEEVSVTQKHRQPRIQRWESQLAFSGNEMWGSDNSGSMVRRTVCVRHRVRVDPKDVNPNLFKDLIGQRGRVMYLMCNAYMAYVAEYGNTSLKNVMPELFKREDQEIITLLNTAQNFVNTHCEVQKVAEAEERERLIAQGTPEDQIPAWGNERAFFVDKASFEKAYRQFYRDIKGEKPTGQDMNFDNVFAPYLIKEIKSPNPLSDPFNCNRAYYLGIRLKESPPPEGAAGG